MKPTDFAVQLSRYLGAYLPGQLGSSVNTVRSYRDTFSLFLRYCSNEHGLPPQTLTLDKITHTLIEQFLLWLENEKMCCAATRNNRLAAIHAFYRYLQLEMPQLLKRCQDILAVPYKKTQKKVMPYLTLDGIKAILAQPNIATVSGRRDLAMLSLLYDPGARVQELVDLRMMDVRLSSPTVIRLTGKGNKARLVPIMAATEKLLRQYLDEHDKDHSAHSGYPLFCNRSGKKLTRAGVAYILNNTCCRQKCLTQVQCQNRSPPTDYAIARRCTFCNPALIWCISVICSVTPMSALRKFTLGLTSIPSAKLLKWHIPVLRLFQILLPHGIKTTI